MKENNMRCVVIFMGVLLFINSCQKQASRSHIKSIEESILPDENTFFPLLVGSSWYYADYIAGERDLNSLTRDSVVKYEQNDTGYFITVSRYSEATESNDTIFYSVNKKGEVFKLLSIDDKPEIFALLKPEIGSKIGEMTYTDFCSKSTEDSGVCMRLEEYPYDSAKTQTAKMKWQFFYFKKGIGIVANGGDELVTRLERYKIGNEPFKDY